MTKKAISKLPIIFYTKNDQGKETIVERKTSDVKNRKENIALPKGYQTLNGERVVKGTNAHNAPNSVMRIQVIPIIDVTKKKIVAQRIIQLKDATTNQIIYTQNLTSTSYDVPFYEIVHTNKATNERTNEIQEIKNSTKEWPKLTISNEKPVSTNFFSTTGDANNLNIQLKYYKFDKRYTIARYENDRLLEKNEKHTFFNRIKLNKYAPKADEKEIVTLYYHPIKAQFKFTLETKDGQIIGNKSLNVVTGTKFDDLKDEIIQTLPKGYRLVNFDKVIGKEIDYALVENRLSFVIEPITVDSTKTIKVNFNIKYNGKQFTEFVKNNKSKILNPIYHGTAVASFKRDESKGTVTLTSLKQLKLNSKYELPKFKQFTPLLNSKLVKSLNEAVMQSAHELNIEIKDLDNFNELDEDINIQMAPATFATKVEFIDNELDELISTKKVNVTYFKPFTIDAPKNYEFINKNNGQQVLTEYVPKISLKVKEQIATQMQSINVNQTIFISNPENKNQKPLIAHQTTKLSRTVTTNKATNKTINMTKWTGKPLTFAANNVPGYQISKQVPDWLPKDHQKELNDAFDSGKDSLSITNKIAYEPSSCNLIVNYIDANQTIVKKETLTGLTNQKIPIDEITQSIPANWEVAIDNKKLKELTPSLTTFSPNLKPMYIPIKHQIIEHAELLMNYRKFGFKYVTIQLNLPNGNVYFDTVGFKRSLMYDKVDHQLQKGDWTYLDNKKQKYADFNFTSEYPYVFKAALPERQSTLDAVFNDKVTADSENQIFDLQRVEQAQHQKFNFVDKNMKVISSLTLSGKIGQTISVVDFLKIPEGWELVDPNHVEPSFTFDQKAHRPFDIFIKHKILDVTNDYPNLFTKVQRNITISLPNGNLIIWKQSAVAKQAVYKDAITGKINKNDKVETGLLPSFSIPVIPGYKSSIDSIPMKVVKLDGNSETINCDVKYEPISHTITLRFIDADAINDKNSLVKTIRVEAKTGESLSSLKDTITKSLLGTNYVLLNADKTFAHLPKQGPTLNKEFLIKVKHEILTGQYTKSIAQKVVFDSNSKSDIKLPEPEILKTFDISITEKKDLVTNKVLSRKFEPETINLVSHVFDPNDKVLAYEPKEVLSKTIKTNDFNSIGELQKAIESYVKCVNKIYHVALNITDRLTHQSIKRINLSGKFNQHYDKATIDQLISSLIDLGYVFGKDDIKLLSDNTFGGSNVRYLDDTNAQLTISLAHQIQDVTNTNKGAHKIVTRTIDIWKGNKLNKSIKQDAKLIRKASLDKVTNKVVYGSWNTAEWPRFNAKKLNGYIVDQPVINTQTVTENSSDQNVKILYTPEEKLVKINWYDDDSNLIIKSRTISLFVDDKKDLEIKLDDGYELSDSNNSATLHLKGTPDGITVNNEKPTLSYSIHVKHKLINVTRLHLDLAKKSVSRIIKLNQQIILRNDKPIKVQHIDTMDAWRDVLEDQVSKKLTVGKYRPIEFGPFDLLSLLPTGVHVNGNGVDPNIIKNKTIIQPLKLTNDELENQNKFITTVPVTIDETNFTVKYFDVMTDQVIKEQTVKGPMYTSQYIDLLTIPNYEFAQSGLKQRQKIFFDANSRNNNLVVELKHAKEASIEKIQLTRTIKFNKPNLTNKEKALLQPIIQHAGFMRTIVTDLVNGSVEKRPYQVDPQYGDIFPKVELPNIRGYEPAQNVTEEVALVDNDNSVITVDYLPVKNEQVIELVDKDGKVIHSEVIDGLTDTVKTVDVKLPDGWIVDD